MAKVLRRFIYLSLIIGAGFLANMLLYSSASLVIEGPHNPLTARVYAGSTRLYPSGNEGRTYSLRARFGTRKVVLSGPSIKQMEAELSIKPFSKQSSTVKVQTKSQQEAAVEAIQPKSGDSVSSILTFGDGSWMTAVLRSENTEDNGRLYAIHYNYSKNSWESVTSEGKIDTSDDKRFADAPSTLIKYLANKAGD